MHKLPATQEKTIELLVLFDKICRKYRLKYTLIYDTLLGAIKKKGFLINSYDGKVAMPYEDYCRFLEICKSELQGEQYYLVNNESDERLDILWSYLAKRSRVQLPENRKQDEIFYDFVIEIIPIFNSSNNIKEFRKDLKLYNYLWDVIEVRKYPKNFKIRRKLKYYFNTRPKLKEDRNDAFNKLLQYRKRNNNNSKYVLFGYSDKRIKEDILIRDMYNDLVEVEFENHKFFAIKESEKWLKSVYKDEFNADVDSVTPNVFLLKGPEELRRVQLVQLEMLKVIDDICRKHNINYFLCSGTLLGAIRHGGFIPWDYDADLAMLKEDYDKFLEVASKELDNEKYIARNITTEPTIHITYTQLRRKGTSFIRSGRENNKNANHGILVDIFPVYDGGNTFIKHKLQTKFSMFFKTMFWTHNGASTEKRYFKRKYYEFLAKFPTELSYNAYMKYANMYKGENTNKVAWLVAANNPYYSDFTDKKNYTEYIEIEFEGYKFKTIKNWDVYLKSVYSDQYGLFPNKLNRVNGFVASGFDAGDLYRYDDKESENNGAKK